MKTVILGAFVVPFSKYPFWTSFSSISDHVGDPFGPLWAPKSIQKKAQQKNTKKKENMEPVLAREREARFKVGALFQARCK